MSDVIFIITVIATIIFVAQFILSFIGFDYDLDIEIEFGSFEFDYLNLKTICMFILMFGWTYILCDDWSETNRLLVGLINGILSVVALVYILKKIYSLEDIDIEEDNTKYLNTKQLLFTYYNGVGSVIINGKEFRVLCDSNFPHKSGDMVLLKEVFDSKTFKI